MQKKSKKPKKQPESIFDENGRWVEERSRIKQGMRRAFRLSPMFKEALDRNRVLLPNILKDGSLGKKPKVRIKCDGCGELFPISNIEVDHIEPAVPVWCSEEKMTLDELARGIFCNSNNLQCLCVYKKQKKDKNISEQELREQKKIKKDRPRRCHSQKSRLENYCRGKWKDFLEKADGFIEINEKLIKQKNEEFKKEYFIFLNEQKSKQTKKGK